MRISDDRYSRDRFRLDLALRFIRHEARTRPSALGPGCPMIGSANFMGTDKHVVLNDKRSFAPPLLTKGRRHDFLRI